MSSSRVYTCDVVQAAESKIEPRLQVSTAEVSQSALEAVSDDFDEIDSQQTEVLDFEGEDFWPQKSIEIYKNMEAHGSLEEEIHFVEALKLEKRKEYTSAEKQLIARVVYAEARGELFEGQVAVATVVLNRYESGLYGSSIREIVFAPDQFAITAKYNDSGLKAVEEAIDRRGDYPYNMYYFQVSRSKRWRNFVYYKRIGNHSFYLARD